jgi:hypothetical protein
MPVKPMQEVQQQRAWFAKAEELEKRSWYSYAQLQRNNSGYGVNSPVKQHHRP